MVNSFLWIRHKAVSSDESRFFNDRAFVNAMIGNEPSIRVCFIAGTNVPHLLYFGLFVFGTLLICAEIGGIYRPRGGNKWKNPMSGN